MTIYTSRVDLASIMFNLQQISNRRKALRKEAAKVLRINSSLIKDKKIKSKIQGGYFKDFTDIKVISALEDLYFQ